MRALPSNDYRRMGRQRCFLSALADQLDVASVLRHFGSLADAVESSVRTDIPLNRAPDLARLTAGVDRKQTLTETFGPPYFAGRRWDRFPYPNVGKIQLGNRVLAPTAVEPERDHPVHAVVLGCEAVEHPLDGAVLLVTLGE